MLVLTERERSVLVFAGEMFGLPMSLVGEVAARHSPTGLSDTSAEVVARRLAARLEQAGLARRERFPVEGTWLIPTGRGLSMVGLEYAPWRPAGWKLQHHATVTRLRLALQAQYPEAGWESERSIRRRWRGQGRARRADGALLWPDGTATGVECELWVKARRPPGVLSGSDRYADIIRQADPRFSEVWWFAPAAQVSRLQGRLQEAGGGERYQVYPLPEGVAR